MLENLFLNPIDLKKKPPRNYCIPIESGVYENFGGSARFFSIAKFLIIDHMKISATFFVLDQRNRSNVGKMPVFFSQQKKLRKCIIYFYFLYVSLVILLRIVFRDTSFYRLRHSF